jgi:signal transduction histidine kinase
MTAGIAHEIKNPLGVIQGSAQVMLDRERPWQMRERAARFIIDEVERLDETLKAFLLFARPASPSFTETHMVRLLEETLSATQQRYEDQGYQFICTYDEDVPPIEADAYQIRQAFWNIYLNALQAMPDGGIVTISVHVEREQQIPEKADGGSAGDPLAIPCQWLALSISDNGCGIPREKMDKIMDPFVSLRDDGIGLGLSIVAQIVKIHQGRIKVTSTEGEGTNFTLYFPCILKENTIADQCADS